MAEISLEQKNTKLKDELQESTKQEKMHAKIIIELNKKLTEMEMDTITKTKISEKLKRNLKMKLEKTRAELNKKELEQKQKDFKYDTLRLTTAQLNAKFEVQKNQLLLLKQQLISKDQAQEVHRKTTLQGAFRITELTNEIAALKQTNENLQRSLTNEKKSCKLFLDETNARHKIQKDKLESANKDLLQQKHIIATLTAALTRKISECRKQKEAMKVVELSYQRKNLEVSNKMKDLEKKEEELKNRTCEYCGL